VGSYDSTPLHWVAEHVPPGDAHLAALDLLVRQGADVDARDKDNETPVFKYACEGYLAGLQRLLGHGASVNHVVDCIAINGQILPDGQTPLMWACRFLDDNPADRRAVALEVLRASSRETRQAVSHKEGWSAVDFIVHYIISQRRWRSPKPWHQQLIGELLSAGVPVHPELRSFVLPIAAEHAERRERELAARRSSGAHNWRAHEAMVGLALDMGELKGAEKEAEEKRLRVAALELELCELGVGTDSSGSEGESKGESDSESGSGEKGGGDGE
jgi:hypothetical protein